MEETQNNKNGDSEKLKIGNSEKLEIGCPEKLEIGGPEKLETGGPEKLEIGGPEKLEIGATEKLEIGGPEKFEIGAPEKLEIGAPEKLEIGDSENLKIGEYSDNFQSKKCDLCSFHFTTLYKYYRHRIRCWRKLGFFKVCRHCGQDFYFLSLYRRHFVTCWKSHRDNIQIKQNSDLKNAYKVQEKAMERILRPAGGGGDALRTNKFPKTCSVCKSHIRSPAHYKLHLKKKGLCRPQPFTCEVCGRIFKKIHHLLAHEKRKTPCSPIPSEVLAANKNTRGDRILDDKFHLSDQKLTKNISENLTVETSSVSKVIPPVSKQSDTMVSKIIKKEKPFLRSTLNQSKISPKKEFVCEKCGMVFKTRQFYFRHLMRSTPCDLEKETEKNVSTKNLTDHLQFICANSSARLHINENSKIRFYRDMHVLSSSDSKISMKSDIQYPLSQSNERSSIADGKVKQTARKSGPPTINNSKLNKMENNDNSELQYLSTYSSESARNISETPQYWMAKSDNSESLVCDICHKVFSSFSALNKHVKKHPTCKKVKFAVKCPVCLQVFYSAYLLLCHQKNNKHWGKAAKSRTIEYKCPFCDKNFLYVQSRNAHIRNHSSERPQDVELFLQQTTCDVCLQPFVSEGIKLQHMRISHPDQVKPNIKPQHEPQLKSGISSIISQETKQFTTSPTKKTGYKKKIQRNAIVVTSSIEAMLRKHPNTCPVCKKIYCNTFVRDRHFKLHTMEKNFGCNMCPEKFFRSEHLTHHMQKSHNNQLMFECLGCGLRFPTRVHTIQHISKVHTDHSRDSLVLERNISEICVKKTFSPPKAIKRNMQMEKEEPHETICDGNEDQKSFCEICQIKFAKATRLQRHRLSKMHRENFLYTQTSCSVQSQPKSSDKLECSVCGQCFDTVALFVPHRLSHFNFKNIDLAEISDLNPYHCEICSKTLDHHQRVQIHLLWHLRASKFGTYTFPKASASCENHVDSKVSVLKTEKKTGPQVAKKTVSSLLSKSVQNIPHADVKKPLVTCDACNVGFTTKHHYTAHVRRYCQVRRMPVSPESEKPVSTRSLRLLSPKSKLPCRYCSLELSSVSDLKWHEKSCRKVHGSERDNIISDENQITCIQCHCSFFDMTVFNEHQISFCESNSSVADPPHSQIVNKDYWAENQESKDSNNLAMCVPCKEQFATVQSLISHLRACKINTWGNAKIQPLINDDQIHCDNSDSKSKCEYLKDNELSSIHEETKEKYNLTDGLQSSIKDELNTNDLCVQNENATADIKNDNTNSKCIQNEAEYVDKNSQQSQPSEDKNTSVSFMKPDVLTLLDCSEMNVIKASLNEDQDKKGDTSAFSVNEEITVPEHLYHLRENFSQLLYLLVADPELMQKLGWGQRLIDNVLEDVLQHMGQHPVDNCSGQTELDCLRENIQLLLHMCLKEQLMSSEGTNKSVDSIVVEVLELFKAGME